MFYHTVFSAVGFGSERLMIKIMGKYNSKMCHNLEYFQIWGLHMRPFCRQFEAGGRVTRKLTNEPQ